MTGARVPLEAFAAEARQALAVLAPLLAPGAAAWVVGGALRDALLGAPPRDLDLAVTSGALALGRRLADRLGGAWVVLDALRGTGRVLAGVRVDLADFRGPALEDDLRARDFTVNALAAPVWELLERGQADVRDPTGGLPDLAARTVRLCAPGAVDDDPVRALRAVRLAGWPGWRLDPAAEAAIARAAPRTSEVSPERLRDELAAILAEPRAGAGLRALDRLGVLPVLLPESLPMRETPQPQPHRFDVWEHSLRAVEAADLVLERLDALAPWGAGLREHLGEDLGDGVRRRDLVKLAALLHDVAKPETRDEVGERVGFIGHDVLGAERAEGIARRWRLSGRAAHLLARLVAHHLRPMHLAQAGPLTRRARYRFHRDLGADARDLLLLALADAAAVRGDDPLAIWAGAGGRVLEALMEGIPEAAGAAAAPPLLRGEDVMAAFDLAPGPAVGRLLARVREAQALGLVRTREEALRYLAGAEREGCDCPPGTSTQ